MTALHQLTLTELRDALRKRQASPVELMQETLARIDATHASLNAVVVRRSEEDLLADARAAEQRIARAEGRPLEGIPFGVKDLEDAAGLVTSHGSIPFREHVAERDSTQVERLKNAGAILLGKTNAPEFGYTAITKNLVYGVTCSPWNLERTPGGSSGGSAAAMSAEVLPLVTASDGGGSIRIPASFTGCFGLKPSFGRVPRGPFVRWDHGMTSVYGPLTKTVEDAALMLDQVVGHSDYDPASLPHPGQSYVESLERQVERPLRIACSLDLGYAVVQSDIAAAVEDGFKVFEKLGHRLSPLRGGPPDVSAHWGLLNAFELAGHIAPLLPAREADFMKSLLEGIRMAEGITPSWWGEMSRQRSLVVGWCADLFASYDLLITPTVPYDPPPAKGPFPTETEGKSQRMASVASFTIPFNLSWHPAATVRVGMSRANLPIGLQIVGPQHREDLVLQVARAFERERPWHPKWPMRGS
jgi:aspartyl-tRNA(Asn)/glutamyl-tRNA(Gln) amidotransferase subunit A